MSDMAERLALHEFTENGFGMAVVGAVNAGPPAGWACGCAAG